MIHSKKANCSAVGSWLQHLVVASLWSHFSLRWRLCFYLLPPLLWISAFVSTLRNIVSLRGLFVLCSLFSCWNPSLSVCLQQERRIGWRSNRRRPPRSSWRQLMPPEIAFAPFYFCFVSFSLSVFSFSISSFGIYLRHFRFQLMHSITRTRIWRMFEECSYLL